MVETPEVGTPEAMAAAHTRSQAIVQGEKVGTPKLSETPAVAGKYKLVAKVWNQITSEPSALVKTWQRHKRGATVDLNEADADRLLRAGAVVPTTTTQAGADAAQVETAEAKAVAINDAVGAKPVEDTAAQQPVADQNAPITS